MKQIDKTKYPYIEFLNDEMILVNTPNPYTLPIENLKDDIENKLHQLNQSVLFLYDCMRILGINEETAMKEDYSLNKATGDKIMDIAMHKKNVSHEFKKLILYYNW